MSIENKQPLKLDIDIQIEFSAKVEEYINNTFEYPPLACIQTFGCQQNVSDSERLRGMLAKMGYGFTEDITMAQLILFNTCAIREGAEERVFGNIGTLKKLKQQNPNLVIGLCGCMMQQDRVVEKIKKSYPFVTLIFGTHVSYTLPQLLYNALVLKYKTISIQEGDGKIVEQIPVYRDNNIKANIPIMYGCDNFCSYCIVPYVRGRERSREISDIINEAKDLIDKGFKELTLLGQNVNSYGKGLDGDINFAKLLVKLNNLSGDFTIKFMTSHPKDCTKELIDTIKNCEKVSRHIHLPVQSGNNRILKEMNRKYTREEYLELVNYAKENLPDVTFSSDIIVGFPSESYDEFLDTLSLIKEIKYTQLFTFIYSKRPGTAAAEFKDTVNYEDKTKWMNQLLKEQIKITADINNSFVGKTVEVLIDGVKKSDNSKLVGRTNHGILVETDGSKDLLGKVFKINIVSAKNTIISGNIVGN